MIKSVHLDLKDLLRYLCCFCSVCVFCAVSAGNTLIKVFDERIAELVTNNKLEKTLAEGETKEGVSKEEYDKLVASLNRLKPAELQKRVFLHCGAWFSWRGGHYYRLLSEVTGPHCDAEGKCVMLVG